MGAWGDGLYDNDSALDQLSDLVQATPLEASPTHLAVGMGLLLWHSPFTITTQAERFQALLSRRAPWVQGLPTPARAVLERVAADPETEAESTTSQAVLAVTGSYCFGQRHDELLRLPGATPLLRDLARRASELLDDLPDDLYMADGPLVALGVLLQLVELDPDLRPAPDRVARWRATFDALDAAVTEERGFWDGYVARARRGFDLLLRAREEPPGTSA